MIYLLMVLHCALFLEEKFNVTHFLSSWYLTAKLLIIPTNIEGIETM